MFDVRELNVAIELWGVAFCILGIACAALFAPSEGYYRRVAVTMFSLELIAAGGDAIAGIFRGQPGELAWIATHVGNFVTFAGNFSLLAMYTTYFCIRLVALEWQQLRRWVRLAWGVTFLMLLLTALGLFYHIGEDNLYVRSDQYWIVYAYTLVVCVINSMLIIRSRRNIDHGQFAHLMFYAFMPVIAMGAQVLVYGLNFVIVSGILCCVILFLETRAHSARLLAERTEELARSRVELSESRIAVMVSQIQPHFIFNTLDTIYYLCGEDPLRAQDAVDRFSTYLRGNLDSLRRTAPVPIETELTHVRTYLELEKLSMEDLLSWQIDAQADGFFVPALSLQTLVENAVKHGVSKRVDGGTVVVRTWEDSDNWMASVEDDGVGFDTEAPVEEGHTGLENTRMRLAALCGGTLDIASTPGKGTIVTMTIPKEAS